MATDVTASGNTNQGKGNVADANDVQVQMKDQTDDPAYLEEVAKLRWHMRLFFYHPFKWVDNKISLHVGYCAVLLLQFIKIILITVMLFNFGNDRGYFTEIVDRGHTTLRNVLLKNWDASWETLPYPPAHGEFAVYKRDDILERINHAVEFYYNIEQSAIGYFTRPVNDSVIINLTYFDFEGFHEGFEGLKIEKKQLQVDKGLAKTGGMYTYDVSAEFNFYNITQPIKKMLLLTVEFTLSSVRVFQEEEEALCLNIDGTVSFSDQDNNGQVIEDLQTYTTKTQCSTVGVHVKDWDLKRTSIGLAVIVIVLCAASLLVTGLIVGFSIVVFMRTRKFMKKNYQRFFKPKNKKETDLPLQQYILFIKVWDALSIFADIATLIGTIWIATHNSSNFDIQLLDDYTVWLGCGCLVAWFSILRYFKFHIKFHLLFTTIYRAFGDVLAYLLCVGVLFIGFWACGYVVLGSYHVKFQTPEAATETLLAIINGDEIFATLAILDVGRENAVIWWFSRIYIWTYVAIFTIVVLNLLVAIVLSAYEVIREYYKKAATQRHHGPLEVALQDLVEKVPNSHFRNAIRDVISTTEQLTNEENALVEQLQKLFRISEGETIQERKDGKTTVERKIEKGDIVAVLPRTIKSFLNEGPETHEREGHCIIKEFEPFCLRQNKQS